MTITPDVEILSKGEVSKEFVNRNILTFNQAALFVKQLAYGRNADKKTLTSVFTDNCGTCSTKHALLKRLGDENNIEGLKLMVAIINMNKNNSPEVSATLLKYQLNYIPEAHCYLRYKDQIIDLRKTNTAPTSFLDDLIEEIEISPEQISDYKATYHKKHLVTWLNNNKHIHFTLNEIWSIREQCILDLTEQSD
jgi:hypothetical protein